MTSSPIEPRARCPIVQRIPGDLEPWTTHIVSMMQAIQAAGTIGWPAPAETSHCFTMQNQDDEPLFCIAASPTLSSGLLLGDDAELIHYMIDDMLIATISTNPAISRFHVRTGPRSDDTGRHHGYVVWQRSEMAEHARIEISPDNVLTLWRHWPA